MRATDTTETTEPSHKNPFVELLEEVYGTAQAHTETQPSGSIFWGVGGVLVALIGLLGILASIPDSPLPAGWDWPWPMEFALSTASAFVLLGLSLLAGIFKRAARLSTWLQIGVIGIALYNILHYLVLADFHFILPLVRDFPEIAMSFLTAIQLLAASTGLLVYRHYRYTWWATDGLGLIGLWLIITASFASLGYWIELPVLFSYAQSSPSFIGFAVIGLILMQVTLHPPGFLFPLVSASPVIRLLAWFSALASLLILLAGIGTVYLFSLVLVQGPASLLADELFLGFELAAIGLSMLVLALSLRVLFFYETNLHAQAQLQQLNRELEQRVQERTAQLEQVSQEKTRVLSLVSHDLKTPLAAIERFTEILAKDAGNLSAGQKDMLSYMSEGIKQMRAMVTDILDRARIEAGKVTINPEKIDLQDFVNRLMPTVETLASEKNIDVQTDVQAGLQIVADPALLRQILLNLLSNAIKYNKRHGTVWLKCHESNNGQSVAFLVQDTGIGIPISKIPLLFTEFYRIGAGLNSVEGTGLGLTSTKKLVELHGGSIQATSTENVGSTFRVLLPRQAPAPAPKTAVSDGQHPPPPTEASAASQNTLE